jgi:hypothetical protein
MRGMPIDWGKRKLVLLLGYEKKLFGAGCSSGDR